jgi:Pretoxin HINT domain
MALSNPSYSDLSIPRKMRRLACARTCFVAGTLVHTNEGLMPIEQLQVGDLVLSRREYGETAVYHPVVKTYVHDDHEVVLVEYLILEEQDSRHFVATEDHPFWVRDVGWTTAGNLECGHEFDTVDGRENVVVSVRYLFRTEMEDVGYTHDEGRDKGPTIDLRNAAVRVSSSGEDVYNDFAFRHHARLHRRVFNIAVAETHTYFVGEIGVWVHNANCGDGVLVDRGREFVDLEGNEPDRWGTDA